MFSHVAQRVSRPQLTVDNKMVGYLGRNLFSVRSIAWHLPVCVSSVLLVPFTFKISFYNYWLHESETITRGVWIQFLRLCQQKAVVFWCWCQMLFKCPTISVVRYPDSLSSAFSPQGVWLLFPCSKGQILPPMYKNNWISARNDHHNLQNN